MNLSDQFKKLGDEIIAGAMEEAHLLFQQQMTDKLNTFRTEAQALGTDFTWTVVKDGNNYRYDYNFPDGFPEELQERIANYNPNEG